MSTKGQCGSGQPDFSCRKRGERRVGQCGQGRQVTQKGLRRCGNSTGQVPGKLRAGSLACPFPLLSHRGARQLGTWKRHLTLGVLSQRVNTRAVPKAPSPVAVVMIPRTAGLFPDSPCPSRRCAAVGPQGWLSHFSPRAPKLQQRPGRTRGPSHRHCPGTLSSRDRLGVFLQET